MAARRLLIAMLVMLVISMVAAALVPPPPPEPDGSTTRSAAETTAPDPAPEGRSRQVVVNADDRRPRRIRLELGDQLALRVSSSRFHIVELPKLGETEDTAPLSPARFDLLLTAPGSYPLRLAETGRTIARIVVAPGGGGNR